MSPRSRSIVAASTALALFVALIAWFARRERAAAQAPTIERRAESSSPPQPQPELARDATENAPEPTELLVGEAAEPTKSAAKPATASAPVLCSVLGFVWPPSGGALDVNVRVYFVDHLGRQQFSTASPDGEYSITGLEPGTWWVSCEARCGAVQTRIELQASEPERRLDLRLVPPREVRVKVTSTTGEPIAVATLAAATLEDPGEWIYGAGENSVAPLGVGVFHASDSYGVPQSGGYIGSILLDIDPPVFVSLVRYQRVLATQRIERLGQDAEFVIDPHSPLLDNAKLLGRAVIASTREPPSAALVLLDGPGTAISRLELIDRGSFVFDHLPPGRYCVRIASKGISANRRCALLEPGATVDLGDVELQPELTLDALVVDENGRGVWTTYSMESFGGDPSTAWPSPTDEVKSNKADGLLHVAGLMAGKYVLTLPMNETSRFGRMLKLVDLSHGPVEGLRIELSPGVALVISAANENALGLRWTLRNSDGLRVMSTRLRSIAPMALSFAPGKYTVEVETPNGAAPIVHEVVLEKDPVELALP